MIKIVTDSSIQLTPEEIERYQITIVPLKITIDGKTYTDGVDISRAEFVEKMKASSELPKTSQPSIGAFEKVFEDITAKGDQVLGIFVTEALSGTINAAKQAADLVDRKDLITVFDSHLSDRAEAFQVLAAAQDVEAGKSVDEILDHIKKIRDNLQFEMMVVNLKNIIKSGRLGAVSGTIATLLSIRVEIVMPGGKLKIAKKGRGKRFTEKFDEKVLGMISAAKDKISEIGISYVDTPEQMNELANRIKEINNKIKVVVRRTSSVVATHVGSGAYAIMWYTN